MLRFHPIKFDFEQMNDYSLPFLFTISVGYNPINGEAYSSTAKDEPVKPESNTSSENVQPKTTDEKPTIVPDQTNAQKVS